MVDVACVPAPCFVIYHVKVKSHTSGVYEGAKKGEQGLYMELPQPQPVGGDICIEFYNKPKMMKKVSMLHNKAEVMKWPYHQRYVQVDTLPGHSLICGEETNMRITLKCTVPLTSETTSDVLNSVVSSVT